MRGFGNVESRRVGSKVPISVSQSDAFRRLHDDRNASRGTAETQRDTSVAAERGAMTRHNMARTLGSETLDCEKVDCEG